MHIRDQRNSNNFHGYKKIDLIINSKFIYPNKHSARELHHMDLKETIVLRIQREREKSIQLLTMDPKVYKELLTHHRRGANGSGEPLRDGVQIGSGGSGLCGSWMNISSTLLGLWYFWGIYRAKRRSRGHPRWAQPTRARLGLPAATRAHCLSSGP